MGAGTIPQKAKDFQPRVGMGTSPQELTKSGAGRHGKNGRRRHRADRQGTRQRLRAGDWS